MTQFFVHLVKKGVQIAYFVSSFAGCYGKGAMAHCQFVEAHPL